MGAWLYAVQITAANPKAGYWCHLVDLYIWAFFVQRVPLLRTEEVGAFIAEGWILIYVPALLFGVFPGHEGRFDKFPWEMHHYRARHYLLEGLMVLSFTTVPT